MTRAWKRILKVLGLVVCSILKTIDVLALWCPARGGCLFHVLERVWFSSFSFHGRLAHINLLATSEPSVYQHRPYCEWIFNYILFLFLFSMCIMLLWISVVCIFIFGRIPRKNLPLHAERTVCMSPHLAFIFLETE